MTKEREKKLIELFDSTDLTDERYWGPVTVNHGENAADVVKRLRVERKKATISMRLSNGVISKAKAQAASAGIPWTSYISAIVERAVMEPQTQPAQPQTV